MTTETTRTQIIQHAERLVQERGCNGFSYRDLAALIGIKAASIHYYFPTKDDLILAIAEQYHTRWYAAMQTIGADLPADAKLRAYIDAHRHAFCNSERICLGAALAADVASLPDDVKRSVQAFYRANEDWLTQVLEQGVREGSLRVSGDPRTTARSAYAALQGSLISARLFKNSERVGDLLSDAFGLR